MSEILRIILHFRIDVKRQQSGLVIPDIKNKMSEQL
jgi:hypothetical protein